MAESITSKGKNTREALDVALSLLGKELTEVEVEIIENGEKGFLGIKSKPAIVKVKVKGSNPIIEDEPQSIDDFISTMKIENLQQSIPLKTLQDSLKQDDLSGKAWVLDGRVFCKDADDKYPLFKPLEGVQIYKNGKLITSTEVICEADIIEVELLNENVLPIWEIKISADKLQAFLVIKAGESINRTLKNQEPKPLIHIETIEVRKPLYIEPHDVILKLKELGIVHGLDYEAINSSCASSEGGTFLIAEGTSPTKGKDGYFQLYNNVEIKKQLKERGDGSVDFRDFREFPSVNFGQIIGEVVPPKVGKAGMSVMGEIIEPIKVNSLKLKAGTGVLLVDDLKVVSTESGYPEVKISGQLATVTVIPKLVLYQNVTIETGNVNYLGAVEIKASVMDGMKVEAKGNILIEENVYRAKILSGKSIIANKNVIASQITAGNGSLIKLELSNILMRLSDALNNMNSAITQLSHVSAFKVNSLKVTGLAPLVKILCDSKFKDIPLLINEFVKKVREHADLESEWIDFADKLYREFTNFHISTLKGEEDIANIANQAKSLYLSVASEKKDDVPFIKADFVQNSEIYSNGNILISGQGVYSSNLFARKNVVIKGFVRGGEIYAEDSVTINEVGYRTGSYVKIAVSKKGYIKIKNASENTTIQVGGQSQVLFNKANNIYARLDEQGILVVSKEE
ncbi:FapA family protein [Ureibacillus chungkukjangi]|uniref:FapA family protein n=1 Tax=Ureibacillus chungkukjangi TaxID=1202712 RepID=UPI002040EAA3|nr:FapA family protein [Ureibacillus chungkukjangi]MCM3390373.1 FapA family protein [Ureibacillus chungkukjangi]